MDFIGQTIKTLRAQIQTMHNDTMNYRPGDNPKKEESEFYVEMGKLRTENQILRSRILILEAQNKDYQETNEELAEQVKRFLKNGARI